MVISAAQTKVFDKLLTIWSRIVRCDHFGVGLCYTNLVFATRQSG